MTWITIALIGSLTFLAGYVVRMLTKPKQETNQKIWFFYPGEFEDVRDILQLDFNTCDLEQGVFHLRRIAEEYEKQSNHWKSIARKRHRLLNNIECDRRQYEREIGELEALLEVADEEIDELKDERDTELLNSLKWIIKYAGMYKRWNEAREENSRLAEDLFKTEDRADDLENQMDVKDSVIKALRQKIKHIRGEKIDQAVFTEWDETVNRIKSFLEWYEKNESQFGDYSPRQSAVNLLRAVCDHYDKCSKVKL